jgi:hypothetical protein
MIALFLFLVFFPAYGQNYPAFRSILAQITEGAKIWIGPFGILPTIQFINIGYINDVYSQYEDNAPVSDFTVTFAPEVQVQLLFRNYLILSFAENPDLLK